MVRRLLVALLVASDAIRAIPGTNLATIAAIRDTVHPAND
jgi:hypothetical protein